MIQVFVPGHPPGGNDRKRMHWMVLRREDEHWAGVARLCALDAVSKSDERVPFGRCRVTVEYHYPRVRRRDWDNLVPQVKGVLDGLTGVVWVDDNTDVIVSLDHRLVIGVRDGINLIVESLQDVLLPP